SACLLSVYSSVVPFFVTPPTTGIYTLSLHDALPISLDVGDVEGRRLGTLLTLHDTPPPAGLAGRAGRTCRRARRPSVEAAAGARSEEHTSELQSPDHLVCRLLLEKKKQKNIRASLHI